MIKSGVVVSARAKLCETHNLPNYKKEIIRKIMRSNNYAFNLNKEIVGNPICTNKYQRLILIFIMITCDLKNKFDIIGVSRNYFVFWQEFLR